MIAKAGGVRVSLPLVRDGYGMQVQNTMSALWHLAKDLTDKNDSRSKRNGNHDAVDLARHDIARRELCGALAQFANDNVGIQEALVNLDVVEILAISSSNCATL